MEKCDSLFVIQTVLSFFFSFIEEPRINAQKEAKRGTLLTSWVFRPLPGFIYDETQSASGLRPKNWGAAHPRRPFYKRSIKTLKLFCDSPVELV